MTRIDATQSAAGRENSTKYPTNSVVVATVEGLDRFPERIRKRLANRWGVVHGVRPGAKEVMVHYPPLDTHSVEMLVPYFVEGAALAFVPDDEVLALWRKNVEDYRAKKYRRFGGSLHR